MRRISSSTWIALAACQDGSIASGAPGSGDHARGVIEVRDATGNVTARVLAGRPCRATVGVRELIVGGRPLVATSGASHWTGEDAPNGTTLKLNDQPIARIHAKQLFDAEGIPLLRVLENGDIASGAGRIVRRLAWRADGSVTIQSFAGSAADDVVVSGLLGSPDDAVLAAMLAAPEAAPEVRAIAACHYLLPDT